MTDSIAPIIIGTDWTDIYAESGISVGAPLLVMPLGKGSDVRIAISATKPSGIEGTKLQINTEPKIDGEQSGAWIRSSGDTVTVLVQSDSGGAARVMPFSESRVIDGNKAITTQPFTELNSKTGRQYYSAFYISSLAASSSVDIVISVGDDPMLIKDLEIQFDSELFSYQLFRTPTYSGGSDIPVYNFNDENAVADDVTITANVTATVDGTSISPEIYTVGDSVTGNRSTNVMALRVGIERVLWSNAEYLLRLTNQDASNASKVSGVATWYQGPISTEL